MSNGPLAGVRVLEFSQIVAGPFAGLALADLGADVVKVEPPEGEARRNAGAVVPNEGKYFQSLNRGKRSLVLDLARPGARETVHRLVPHFDVVLSNYRWGVTQRLGIDYETLSAINPGLIYANITGFGEQGPSAARAGSDIVAQAYTGLMASEAKTDQYGAPDRLASAPVIDQASGLSTAMGISAALYHRANTGEGQELQVSLLGTGLQMLAHQVMHEPVHDVTLRDPLLAELRERRDSGAPYDEIADVRRKQGPRIAGHRLYYGGYHTKRGALVLGALTRQNREVIRGIIGVADETDSPDFDANDPADQARIDTWRDEIQARLLERTAEEWVDEFLAAGVPASVVNFAEEMADDPQVRATNMMMALEHPVTGPQQVVGPLVRMSRTTTGSPRSAPPLNHHTAEVLRECGFAGEDLDRLSSDGVISLD